jgi:hypothetical protein
MNIKLEELIELKACTRGLNRFKSLNLEVATLEQTLSVCTVSDVLWYLGKYQSNFSNIVVFAQWCLDAVANADANVIHAAKYAAEYARIATDAVNVTHAARYAAKAADAVTYAVAYVAFNAYDATEAAYTAADAVREKQKAKLLELFS